MAEDKIRILIVDDIAETRENIRKLLQFENDVEVVGAARSGREAIDLALELEPDVVLMDINMPDMDGITATEKIREKISWVQIVILSVQGDPNYMRRAMLAGARDFLTKPPTIDELVSAIRRAGVMAHSEKDKAAATFSPSSPGSGPLAGYTSPVNGKIIMVYSPKGGTGCTTLAVNIGVSLQSEEKQVVIVDGNLQYGDVKIFFNEQGKNHIGDLTPRVNELEPDLIEDVMITHAESGVKILAAPPRPEMAEEVNSDQFAQLLNYLRRIYSYVIVDTSSTITDVVLAGVEVSDLVILITTQDIPSIANARLFLDLTSALGFGKDHIWLVLNKFDKRINITPEKLGEILRKEVISVIPVDSRTTIPSITRGIPLMLDSKNRSQPIGKAIGDLVDFLHDRIEATEGQEVERQRLGKR